jgi:hypothetical protein
MSEKDVPPRYRLGVQSTSPVEGDDEDDEPVPEEFEHEPEEPKRAE